MWREKKILVPNHTVELQGTRYTVFPRHLRPCTHYYHSIF